MWTENIYFEWHRGRDSTLFLMWVYHKSALLNRRLLIWYKHTLRLYLRQNALVRIELPKTGNCSAWRLSTNSSHAQKIQSSIRKLKCGYIQSHPGKHVFTTAGDRDVLCVSIKIANFILFLPPLFFNSFLFLFFFLWHWLVYTSDANETRLPTSTHVHNLPTFLLSNSLSNTNVLYLPDALMHACIYITYITINIHADLLPLSFVVCFNSQFFVPCSIIKSKNIASLPYNKKGWMTKSSF